MNQTIELRPDATAELTELLRSRIMVLDGAMGTAIQRDRPDEAGYRGERFKDWPSDVQGNNDLLTLTQPEIIAGIHREYLEAGADMIETNTFNATTISLSDYGMEELAHELNFESARLARRECDAVEEATGRRRYVAGTLGPTSSGLACRTECQNASVTWPDNVRPDASVMVPEMTIGQRRPRSSKTDSTAKIAALALSVSKIVSMKMTSEPPSSRPRVASAYASTSCS